MSTNTTTITTPQLGPGAAGYGELSVHQHYHPHYPPAGAWGCRLWRAECPPTLPPSLLPSWGLGLVAMGRRVSTNTSTLTTPQLGPGAAGYGELSVHQHYHPHYYPAGAWGCRLWGTKCPPTLPPSLPPSWGLGLQAMRAECPPTLPPSLLPSWGLGLPAMGS